MLLSSSLTNSRHTGKFFTYSSIYLINDPMHPLRRLKISRIFSWLPLYIGLLGLLPMISCQCDRDTDKEANLILQVNKTLLEGTDTSVEVWIKNQSNISDKSAILGQFKLKATISEQKTAAGNAGSGSKFSYTTAEGQQTTEPYIDILLDQLNKNEELSPKIQRSFYLTSSLIQRLLK